MKITRRGLFKTAGAVVVAPALSLVHSISHDKRTGSFHLAFYLKRGRCVKYDKDPDGIRAGDELSLSIGEDFRSHSDPTYRDKRPLQSLGDGEYLIASFEIKAPVLAAIRSGWSRYEVSVTLNRPPSPIRYVHRLSEGNIELYGEGPDDWSVIIAGKGYPVQAYKDYQP